MCLRSVDIPDDPVQLALLTYIFFLLHMIGLCYRGSFPDTKMAHFTVGADVHCFWITMSDSDAKEEAVRRPHRTVVRTGIETNQADMLLKALKNRLKEKLTVETATTQLRMVQVAKNDGPTIAVIFISPFCP
jgi:hypothetical protein